MAVAKQRRAALGFIRADIAMKITRKQKVLMVAGLRLFGNLDIE